MNIILSILSIIILNIVSIVDIIYKGVIKVRDRKWYKLVNKRYFGSAYMRDVLANYQYADLWNAMFSTGGYEFGRMGETLSSCLGKKQLEKTLTKWGWFWLIIINIVDVNKWFKRGHCIASIQTEKQIKDFIKL